MYIELLRSQTDAALLRHAGIGGLAQERRIRFEDAPWRLPAGSLLDGGAQHAPIRRMGRTLA